MNCFCGMVGRQNELSFIFSRDQCQKSSPSRVSDTPWAAFEPVQNLSSGFVEWSCAVMITTTSRRHYEIIYKFIYEAIYRNRSYPYLTWIKSIRCSIFEF